MLKFIKSMRHPMMWIVILLTLQSCTCYGMSLDSLLGRTSNTSAEDSAVRMDCLNLHLTAPRDSLPNGSTTVSWGALAGAVTFRVNVYSGAVRVGTWDAAAPATNLMADMSQNAIGGTDPFELEILAFDANGNYCRDYVTLNRDSSSAVQQLPPTQPEEPAPVLTTSVLTGDVYTMCDPVNRPVNLRLVEGTDPALVTQELANQNLRILIAQRDISSTCKINASNTALLTCTYPNGLTSLPAKGQVIYKSNVIKSFNFDGESGCTLPSGGGNSSGGTEPTEPPVCDPHVDDSCPTDCNDPANADLCG